MARAAPAGWHPATGYGATTLGSYATKGSARKNELIVLDDTCPPRKRLNTPAILQAVLLPCGIFAGASGLLSFWLHYDHREAVYFLLACGFFVSIFFGAKALLARRSAAADREPTWFLFLAATCAVAWIAGVVVGSANFARNMQRYYDLAILDTVREVDPRSIPGSHYLDAGSVFFKEGTFIRQNMTMTYKDRDLFCVAPIVFGDQTVRLASYDYWAVGVNCCDPTPPASFDCGARIWDTEAHAATRWMSTSETAKFRSAIQQAQEEYGVFAGHPLFFTWTKDPLKDLDNLQAAGKSTFVGGIVVHAILQIICVTVMAHSYSSKLAAGLL